MSTTTDPALAFDLTYLDSVEVPLSGPEDVPPHVTLFGTPTIGVRHVAGPVDGTGMVAIWTCDRDGFDYAPIPEAEAAFVFDGVLRATSSTGEIIEARAGEGYRLPVGWSGRIEAIEPVRKVYILL